MQRYGIIYLYALFLALCSCKGTTFQSSVPAYPVRVTINMDLGAFVHFQNQTLGDYIIVKQDGFHYHDELVMPLGTNMCGYGGVIIYVSMLGYVAYDLACPHCASHGLCNTCVINGMNAVCPECGEEYDLGSGSANPRKGISHETLRPLNLMRSGNTITVTQR